jgi:hypothetical protein
MSESTSIPDEAGDLSRWNDDPLQELPKLEELGIKTDEFKKFYEALMARILQLDLPRQLPEGFRGLLESLNLLDPPPGIATALQNWRNGIADKTRKYWLHLLETGDPAKIKQGLEKWAHAVAQFDEAVRQSAEAELAVIIAWQKLVEEIAGGVPVLGTALDLLTAARGETLSGEQVSALNRFIRVAGFLGPALLQKILKRMGRAGIEAAEELGEFSEQIATAEGQKNLARLGNATEAEVKRLADNLSHLSPTGKGVEVERLLMERVKTNLNTIRANFPIVDAISHKLTYVSIADSGRSDRYLMRKFQALFGYGSSASVSKYKSMLAALGELERNPSGALQVEQFLKKAQLAVPDELAEPLRNLIRKKVQSLGTWPDPETFQILLNLNGGDPKKALDYMCNMVIKHSDLK